MFLATATLTGDAKYLMEDHVKFLEDGFAHGQIALFGPGSIAGSGVVIFDVPDATALAEFVSQDPLMKAGVVKYEVMEFEVAKADASKFQI